MNNNKKKRMATHAAEYYNNMAIQHWQDVSRAWCKINIPSEFFTLQ